jgi:hypothetical protein
MVLVTRIIAASGAMDVGTNGILECKFLSKSAHHTSEAFGCGRIGVGGLVDSFTFDNVRGRGYG